MALRTQEALHRFLERRAGKYLVVTAFESGNEIDMKNYLLKPHKRIGICKGNFWIVKCEDTQGDDMEDELDRFCTSLDDLWMLISDKCFLCIHLMYDPDHLVSTFGEQTSAAFTSSKEEKKTPEKKRQLSTSKKSSAAKNSASKSSAAKSPAKSSKNSKSPEKQAQSPSKASKASKSRKGSFEEQKPKTLVDQVKDFIIKSDICIGLLAKKGHASVKSMLKVYKIEHLLPAY
mmetsp:Transcript_33206/g.50896  ORF Transcript_33206/g.50896 Transcript_33206/m.50896 type:complete len:232 (-) Transcript_33206:1720-2415(-)